MKVRRRDFADEFVVVDDVERFRQIVAQKASPQRRLGRIEAPRHLRGERKQGGDSRVLLSEPMLRRLRTKRRRDRRQEHLFHDLHFRTQEADWSVGQTPIGRFTRLQDRYHMCRPPDGGDVRSLNREIEKTSQIADAVRTEVFEMKRCQGVWTGCGRVFTAPDSVSRQKRREGEICVVERIIGFKVSENTARLLVLNKRFSVRILTTKTVSDRPTLRKSFLRK